MEKKKLLYIEIKKLLPEAVNDYCKEAGIDPQEVGYHIGWLTKAGPNAISHIITLSELFFFAGIHHLKNTNKKNIIYKYMDEKKISERVKERQKELKKLLVRSEKKTDTYLG